eukprot:scaffold3061_cov430-Prasinococcus_capsulatus_cf.AAC.3
MVPASRKSGSGPPESGHAGEGEWTARSHPPASAPSCRAARASPSGADGVGGWMDAWAAATQDAGRPASCAGHRPGWRQQRRRENGAG